MSLRSRQAGAAAPEGLADEEGLADADGLSVVLGMSVADGAAAVGVALGRVGAAEPVDRALGEGLRLGPSVAAPPLVQAATRTAMSRS